MRPRQHSAVLATCLLTIACALPRRTRAQAVAIAGPAIANQVSNANPFASQSPAAAPLPCATFVTRSPWGVPALLFGQAPGLLTADNSTYSDATLCCGGVLDFTWTRPHGIWLLAQRACPAMFASNPAAGQLQLHPVTDNGTAVLSFNVPGTYYITSPANTDCAQGMLFAVNVPNDPTNALCTTSGGPTASATGTPGGTSTSTSQNSAAAASGPPGSQNTLTGDGFALSSAG